VLDTRQETLHDRDAAIAALREQAAAAEEKIGSLSVANTALSEAMHASEQANKEAAAAWAVERAALLEQLATANRNIEEAQAALRQRDTDAQELREHLAERDARIAGLEHDIAAQREMASAREQALADAREALAERERERDAGISEGAALRQSLAAAEVQLAEREQAALQERQALQERADGLQRELEAGRQTLHARDAELAALREQTAGL